MTPRTLTEMQHYGTAYEVAINGEVVAYIARKSKRALLETAQDNGEKILAMIGDDDAPASYKDGKWFFGDVAVCFTGRTERDAASPLGLV